MRIGFVLLIGFFVASPLFAVSTSHWTHTSEADFKAGEFEHVVASNLGDVKLSRATQTLLEQDPRISAVYALVEAPADQTIYAGTGPQGVLLSIKGEKVETVAEFSEGQNIYSLLIDNDGRLLVGTSGEKGTIYRIDKPGEEPKEIFKPEEGVQYIWSMRQTADGMLYAATGPEGKLFEIKPDGSSRVVFDSNESNLLCLLSAEPDLLYVGTDPNGLVYRINRKNGEVFVMYDASESEISALAMDAKGNLYAGTAQAGMELPTGVDEMGAADQVGRPEGAEVGVPIPAQEPENPEPPELPDPTPGQPDPIPQRDPQKLMVLPMALQDSGDDVGDGQKDGDDGGDAANEGGDDDGDDNPAAPVEPPETPHAAELPATIPGAPPMGHSETGEAPPGGNAIYRIDRDGFVTEIFRMPVLVLSMLERNGTLLVGTGSEGLVYQINPAADETLVLAKVDPKQVMSLLATSDGRVVLGLANVGGIATMSSGYASEGTYTSPVLDAQQVSRFGMLRVDGALPQDTTLTVSTRSGNVAEPGDVGWSKWSEPAPATRFMPIASPPARFFQYRLGMKSANGKNTAVVEEVDVAYQVPNLAPQVTSIQITASAEAQGPSMGGPSASASGGGGGGNRVQTIAWQATDANEDDLEYTLHFRSGSRGPWILLKDKLTDLTYEWDTRSVADGRYEVRVTASDKKANPRGQGRTASRVSDPVTVDNTAPLIGDLKATPKGTELAIELKAVDRTTSVASIEYSVDSNDDWQAILPSDNIFDSPEERASFTIGDLAPGTHQVTLRATDAKGNQAFETVLTTIEAPAARR